MLIYGTQVVQYYNLLLICSNLDTAHHRYECARCTAVFIVLGRHRISYTGVSSGYQFLSFSRLLFAQKLAETPNVLQTYKTP